MSDGFTHRVHSIRRALLPAAWLVIPGIVAAPGASPAQTMPAPVYHDLMDRGHEKLADHISKRLELRSDPDDEDVRSLLDRWEREAGGPDGGWDWVAVTRLWLRAGRAAEAEMALHEAEASGEVPASVLLLDQSRVAFLAGQVDLGQRAYWKGCPDAGETAYREYWLDIEPLATDEELADWDRFRRLPVTQTDLCGFLRRFWNERALAAGESAATRTATHYRRYRYALDHYRRRGSRKGPTFSNQLGRPRNATFDDRGLVYLRIGEPDRITTFGGNTSIGQAIVSAECYQPNVSWAYDYPEGTRVYHFSAMGGADDYWLIENLGLVYRCGNPAASSGGSDILGAKLSPLNENRFVALGPAASLVLQDLYRSRQGLDTRYAQIAQRMADQAGPTSITGAQPNLASGTAALESQRVLQQERTWTWEDGQFVVNTVPDRPDVAPEARLLVEELQFRAPAEGETRVWLNAVVEAERLRAAPAPDGRFEYRVDATWILLDETGEFASRESGISAVTARRLGRDESLPLRLALDLVPGPYRYTLVVRDAHPSPGARAVGNYRHSELVVRELTAGVPALSDVAVAADSGGTWSPAPGVGLRPIPSHFTGPDGVAFVYFEVYNLTPGGTYTTRIRLQPDGGDEGAFELSYPADGTTAPSRLARRLLRLDLSDTEPGRYDMSVTITDEATENSTLAYHTGITVNRTVR